MPTKPTPGWLKQAVDPTRLPRALEAARAAYAHRAMGTTPMSSPPVEELAPVTAPAKTEDNTQPEKKTPAEELAERLRSKMDAPAASAQSESTDGK